MTEEEKKEVYERYQNTKVNSRKMLGHSFDELPAITFVMLRRLSQYEENFHHLSDTYPTNGHGGTPHIIDTSYGIMMKKRCEKITQRMAVWHAKAEEQRLKIINHTTRVIGRQEKAVKNKAYGTDAHVADLESKVIENTRLQEVMKLWNKATKRGKQSGNTQQLLKWWEEIKGTGRCCYLSNGMHTHHDQGKVFNEEDFAFSAFESFSLTYLNIHIKKLKKDLVKSKFSNKFTDEETKQNTFCSGILALEKEGKATQWNKDPRIFFLNGFKKVGVFSKDGKIAIVGRYAPTDEERPGVENLISQYR